MVTVRFCTAVFSHQFGASLLLPFELRRCVGAVLWVPAVRLPHISGSQATDDESHIHFKGSVTALQNCLPVCPRPPGTPEARAAVHRGKSRDGSAKGPEGISQGVRVPGGGGGGALKWGVPPPPSSIQIPRPDAHEQRPHSGGANHMTSRWGARWEVEARRWLAPHPSALAPWVLASRTALHRPRPPLPWGGVVRAACTFSFFRPRATKSQEWGPRRLQQDPPARKHWNGHTVGGEGGSSKQCERCRARSVTPNSRGKFFTTSHSSLSSIWFECLPQRARHTNIVVWQQTSGLASKAVTLMSKSWCERVHRKPNAQPYRAGEGGGGVAAGGKGRGFGFGCAGRS